MGRALLVRSIPLSSTTSNAWRNAGAQFSRRDRNTESVMSIAYDRPVINLGASWFAPEGGDVWNHARDIAPLLTPKATRNRIGDLLPSNEWLGAGNYWVKGQGRGGRNKTVEVVRDHHAYTMLKSRADWNDADIQRHVDGQEYRVVTVGTKVVQGMKRYGSNADRTYEWVGANGTPLVLRSLVKEAVGRLPSEKVIVAWDTIISGDDAYILEGNSSPGVNDATANRILDAVTGENYESE